MKKLSLTLICFIVCVSSLFAAGNYTIEGDKSATFNQYHLKYYYFVNYFYTDVLLGLDLLDKFDMNDKKQIIKTLFNNMSQESPNVLVVKKYQGGQDLRLGFRVHNIDNKEALIMASNYNMKNKKIVSKDLSKCYARLYYLKGEKLVNSHYMYTAETEQKLKDSKNNLADFYIFDDLDDNDSKVGDLLLKNIESTDSIISKYISYLTLGQAYLAKGLMDKAKESIDTAKTLLDDDLIAKGLDGLHRVTMEEYEMMMDYQSTSSAQ